MIRKHLTAAVCLAALSLTACSDGQMRANRGLCADFKAKPDAAALAEGSGPTDECARRWAYSLASSHDDADAVTEAVSAACAGALSRWNQQGLGQGAPPTDALSTLTGQPTNAMAEHNAYLHARALLYVTQARAGHCSAPPIKDGVPEGVAG